MKKALMFALTLSLSSVSASASVQGEVSQDSMDQSSGSSPYNEIREDWRRNVARYMNRGVSFSGTLVHWTSQDSALVEVLEGEDILVVMPRQKLQAFKPGDEVTIKGFLRQMPSREVNKVLGIHNSGADLEEGAIAPYVMVDSIGKLD